MIGPRASEQVEPSAPRVLIVEDSKDLALLWEKLFKAKGYHPEVFLDARSALERLHQGARFDAVVSDYFLPDLNGLSLLERIREIDPLIPFLLVTGAREPSVQERINGCHWTGFLNKPVKFQVLEERLRELIA